MWTEEDMQHTSLSNLMHGVMGMYMQQAGEMLYRYNIKPPAGGMLMVIRKFGNPSQKDLAGYMRITPPSVTAMIGKLETQNLVERRQDKDDQRVMRIHLTKEGEKCATEMKEAMEELDRIMFTGFSEKEQKVLRSLLIRLFQNLHSSCKDRACRHTDDSSPSGKDDFIKC